MSAYLDHAHEGGSIENGDISLHITHGFAPCGSCGSRTCKSSKSLATNYSCSGLCALYPQFKIAPLLKGSIHQYLLHAIDLIPRWMLCAHHGMNGVVKILPIVIHAAVPVVDVTRDPRRARS